MQHQKSEIQLSLQQRRILNLLEMKVYDISENIQILTHQLNSSQIKDAVAKSYSILSQLKLIFTKMGVEFLYEIVRKMQANSVLICEVLTQHIQKLSKQAIVKKDQSPPKQNYANKQLVNQSEMIQKQTCAIRIPRLGGINLYNQCYRRGLQHEQVADFENTQQARGRCAIKQSKKGREVFLNQVVRQLQNKTDVQVENINDQISNYMRYYRQEGCKISSYVSYQNELNQIIQFFKTSELDAMNFINKQSKIKDFPGNYLHTLNDMEKDIRAKGDKQKAQLLQKVKTLIVKLKDRLIQNQRLFEYKNAKLLQFKKSLQRQMANSSTQTYDGYDRKVKQLEKAVRQNQQKYQILNNLRKNQFGIQDKIYELTHQIQIKQNQNQKFIISSQEKQLQLLYLKKIIRDNRQKMNLTQIDKAKFKILTIQKQNKNNQQGMQESKQKAESPNSQNQYEPGKPRRARRYQKYGTKYTRKGQHFNLDLGQDEQNDQKDNNFNILPQEHKQIVVINSQIEENKNLTAYTNILTQNQFSTNQLPVLQKQRQKQVYFETQEQQPQFDQQFTQQQKLYHQNDILDKNDVNQKSQFLASLDQTGLDMQKKQLKQKQNPKNVHKIIARHKIDLNLANKKSSTPQNKILGLTNIQNLKNKNNNQIYQSSKIAKFEISQQISFMFKSQISKSQIVITKPIQLARDIQHVFRYQRSSYPTINKNTQIISQTQKQLGDNGKFSSAKRISNQYIQTKNRWTANQSAFIVSNKSMKTDSYNQKQSISIYNSKCSNKYGKNILKSQAEQKSKAQIPSLPMTLSKKSRKSLNKFKGSHQDKQMSTSDKIMGLIQLAKKSSLANKKKQIYYKQQNKQQYTKYTQQYDLAVARYIQAQIQQKKLNQIQLQQILKILNGQDELKQQKIDQEQQAKIQQSTNTCEIVNYFHKKHENTSKHQYSQQTPIQINQTQPFIIKSLDRIKNIHFKFSNCCQNKQNISCNHIQKYLQIVVKINQIKNNNKLPMKLPIQTIGQPHQQKQVLHNDKFCINKLNFSKKEQQISDKQNKKFRNTSHDLLREKQRILPILHNTTQFQYKAKNKIIK